MLCLSGVALAGSGVGLCCYGTILGQREERGFLWPKGKNWRKPMPSSGLSHECSFLEVDSPCGLFPPPPPAPMVEQGNLMKSDLDDS